MGEILRWRVVRGIYEDRVVRADDGGLVHYTDHVAEMAEVTRRVEAVLDSWGASNEDRADMLAAITGVGH